MPEFIEINDPEDAKRRWRLQTDFLASNWTCIWGRGCQGIFDEPAEELGHGCCSLGAEMFDPDEARLTSAMAAMLDPARFQFQAEAIEGGIFSDDAASNTRVIDGACIFLNRPGFAGGAGCALHHAAVDSDESPTDWKPSVCWQLPIKIDWELDSDGMETATLRQWARKDWGPEGATMAWICTDEPAAYVGDRPVIESLSDELGALLGPVLYDQVVTAVADNAGVVSDGDGVVSDGVSVVADGGGVVSDGVSVVSDGVSVVADGDGVVSDGVSVVADGVSATRGNERGEGPEETGR